MSDVDQEKVRRLLGTEPLQPLIRKLDRRLAKKPEIQGHVTLKDPPPETREAVTALLGLPPGRTGSLRVSLTRLEQTVRDSGAADSLSAAVETVLGRRPQHPAIENRKLQAEWRSAWRVIQRPDEMSTETMDYLRQICASGVLRRATRGCIEEARVLLRSIAACMTALPRRDPQPLPIFAAEVLGDSHALDADRPIYSLLLRTIGKTNGLAVTSQNHRRIWSAVNLIQDELSSTTLVLNLPVDGEGLLGSMLAQHAAAGQPCRLTFSQLRQHSLVFADPAPIIYVCENPSVLAAAASQLGKHSRPLLCIEGQPSHASAKLLTICRNANVQLEYHGDFDRPGLQITAQILHRFGAQPWRMSKLDYLRHVSRSRLTFEGAVPSTHWEPGLADTIGHHQKKLLEETVIDDLLKDLNGNT